ncbi:MAG: PEP-CTERM sorting domain-containing protein [Tepidisphaeraceae bacterium]|jgi:PEP-CTERM motif-containing protein
MRKMNIGLGSKVCCGAALAAFAAVSAHGAVITTYSGGISPGVNAPYQADYSSPTITGWLDYSNNDQGALPDGGPAQVFLTTAPITLQSVTVKGFGDAGAPLTGNWTITVGSLNGNSDYYGVGFTLLDQETANGAPIGTDVGNGITTNYDMFTLANPVALAAGTEYFFAISSSTSNGGWYGFAMSGAPDPLYATLGISAAGYYDGPPYVNLAQQNNESNAAYPGGGLDFTYYINGTVPEPATLGLFGVGLLGLLNRRRRA